MCKLLRMTQRRTRQIRNFKKLTRYQKDKTSINTNPFKIQQIIKILPLQKIIYKILWEDKGRVVEMRKDSWRRSFIEGTKEFHQRELKLRRFQKQRKLEQQQRGRKAQRIFLVDKQWFQVWNHRVHKGKWHMTLWDPLPQRISTTYQCPFKPSNLLSSLTSLVILDELSTNRAQPTQPPTLTASGLPSFMASTKTAVGLRPLTMLVVCHHKSSIYQLLNSPEVCIIPITSYIPRSLHPSFSSCSFYFMENFFVCPPSFHVLAPYFFFLYSVLGQLDYFLTHTLNSFTALASCGTHSVKG